MTFVDGTVIPRRRRRNRPPTLLGKRAPLPVISPSKIVKNKGGDNSTAGKSRSLSSSSLLGGRQDILLSSAQFASTDGMTLFFCITLLLGYTRFCFAL
jgi:hypothetical protein